MSSYQALEATVRATGLWDNGRRHGSHSFRLSPQPYRITSAQLNELDTLSRAIHRALLGVSRLVAIAGDNNLSGGLGSYNRLYRLLTRGAPYGLATVRPASIPLLAKVDLVVDAQGQFKIAEIDATNPRSWGYSEIGRAICRTLDPAAPLLPGVVGYVGRHLNRLRQDKILFLYGDTQRFYAPEFEVVATALSRHGVAMTVAGELHLTAPIGHSCLVDLPLMNRNKPLIDYLVAQAKARQVRFLIPPKHFLSSKALLAVLSTPDDATQHLLHTQIEASNLAVIRRYLPETQLATPARLERPEGFLLKRTVSSGMKGIAFASHLTAARANPHLYVLQREVDQLAHAWPVYGSDGTCITSDGWYARLTAYASRDGVQDLAVTLRPDKRVHGSPDAVLTGTVLY